MSRRPPSRVRRETPHRRAKRLGNLPGEVVGALERIERADLHPARIALALSTWADLCRQSRRELGNASNDLTTYMGPDARDDLQRALQALPTRPARTLRHRVDPLDRAIAAKTLPEPHSNPNLPWWQRRYTELYRGRPRT